MIGDSAQTLRSMGQAVEEKTATVKTTWDRLTGCYQAPEQEQVYTVMAPAETSAQQVNSRFGEAATHIDTYAGALEAIKPRLADLERRATAFRAKVVNGVWVDAVRSANASFGDHLSSTLDSVLLFEKRRVKVSWTEDGDSVARNTALLEEYAQILAEISTAATTCARSINALLTGVHAAPIEAIPAAAFTSADAQMPWGSPVVEDRNCLESVGHGAHTFGSEFFEGIGMLVFGYNPETEDWWTRAGYGQAWSGLGDLVGSLAVLGSPVGLVAGVKAANGNLDDTSMMWMYERAITVRNAGGSLVGWDPAAEDGWHRWKEDGIAAGTAVTLNVGTFFIPVAGQISAGLKAGSIGARVARIAGVGAELAVQGGSWAVRGSVKLVTGLRTAVARFDLDGLAPTVRAGQIVDAATGMHLNPGGLVNAMTDASHATPGAPSHMPVGEALFGRDAAPDLDTGARTAPDGLHPTHDGQSPPAPGEAPAVRDAHPAGLAQDGAAPHPTAPAPESAHAPGENGGHPNGHHDTSGGPGGPDGSPRPDQSSDGSWSTSGAGDQILHGGADSGAGWHRMEDQPIDPHYGQPRDDAGTDLHPDSEPPAEVAESMKAIGGDSAHTWGTDVTTGEPLTRSEWIARYTHPDGSVRWPDNGGALPGTKVEFTDPAAFAEAFGTKLDRVGEPTGGYLGAPPGSRWDERSLAPETLGKRVFTYILEPAAAAREGVTIRVSKVAPAFGQPGGGTQVQFWRGETELKVQQLTKNGVLLPGD